MGFSAFDCASMQAEVTMGRSFDEIAAECAAEPPGTGRACITQLLARRAMDNTVIYDAPVFPDVYAGLYLRVDGVDVSSDESGLVVRSGAPVLFRFLARGGLYAAQAGPLPVVKQASGELALGRVDQEHFVFAVKGTGTPNELVLHAVVARGARLVAAAGTVLVSVRRQTLVAVDVMRTAKEVAALDFALSTASIDKINVADCCAKVGASGACGAVGKQRYPLCCSQCTDTLATCAWRARVDVLTAMRDTPCCATHASMLAFAENYSACGAGDPTSQYETCEPSAEHSFAFVPRGVWSLAPNGIRIPAYGVAYHMRGAGAGYRGVSCRTL